ncbi:MAG: hypothetical protein GC166_01280 [Alphaproteobacteria bacterium]|nr:hypothetical protein [Alphaproteobacteria bacterium]
MSFREKAVWVSLVSYLIVYGLYFWRYGAAVMAGGGADYMGSLISAVLLLVVLEVVLTIAISATTAIAAPQDVEAPLDERERQIAQRANGPALHVVTIGVLGAIAALYYGVSIALVINCLFLALVLAEMTKSAVQIVLFRKGA